MSSAPTLPANSLHTVFALGYVNFNNRIESRELEGLPFFDYSAGLSLPVEHQRSLRRSKQPGSATDVSGQ